MKTQDESYQLQISNGEPVEILKTDGSHDYFVQWGDCQGSMKKVNIEVQLPEEVIAANPNRKFSEVFLWRHGQKIPVPNGTTLPVSHFKITDKEFFYFVKYAGGEYSVKRENVKGVFKKASTSSEHGASRTGVEAPA